MMKTKWNVTEIENVLNRIESGDADTLALYPEIAGMRQIHSDQAALLSIEHHGEGDNPVWAHLKNVIGRLGGVADQDLSRFQAEPVLSAVSFMEIVQKYQSLYKIPLLIDCLHLALLFSDISKGGLLRQDWERQPDVDFSVHNEASAAILKLAGTFERLGLDSYERQLCLALIQSHGLMGQFVRGEITYGCFEPWRKFLKDYLDRFAGKYINGDVPLALELLSNVYLLLNVIDTAGVREGLMTDDLYYQFKSVDLIQLYKNGRLSAFSAEIERRMSELSPESGQKDILYRNLSLAVRLEHLRSHRLKTDESAGVVMDEIASLSDKFVSWFSAHFDHCQLWYCESATGDLSVSAQVKCIAVGMYLWQKSALYRDDSLFHIDFAPLAMWLSPFASSSSPERSVSRSNYRKRLLEAILADQSYESIMDGTSAIYGPDMMIGMDGRRGSCYSVSLKIDESEEATALITLLSIYERKSSVAYHSALKLLCDLYHLRKDDFDRLANEAQYLVTMNAAKSDKARMLRWLHSGKIVEVGPGGGVVLDLLEQAFPEAEITGLDLSQQVVSALSRKKMAQHARWNIIEGNAFELPNLFGPETLDGVVFCSILHEIYSYVESPDGSRFHLESVRDMLRAAFGVLRPGGRILIRDGIMPPHEPRLLEFCCDDAREFFDAFCREFKGRTIQFETAGAHTVRLDSADAMEFMYTYTWGPDSFPYEVREQYGVLPYDDYCAHIRQWLGERARILTVPPAEAQYLQPGYVEALKDRLKLMDESGRVVDFPPSNAIIVIDKV